MEIELTEEQIQNVIILLQRVDLKGSEAMGLVELQQVFQMGLQPTQKHPTPEY